MIRTIRTGIDIGTYMVRVVVAEYTEGDNLPHILGTGFAYTYGLRRGYIVNQAEAQKSLRKAVAEAEKASNTKIKRAIVSICGASLSSTIGVGACIISRADQEITNLDIKKAIEEAQKTIAISNKKILHTLPLQFRLDGKEVMGNAVGLNGVKLEVRTMFVTALAQHVDDMINLVSNIGIDVLSAIATPFASEAILLSDRQKNAGVALVDMGAETTTLSVFENGMMMAIQVFPIGSLDITNDIALGLQISLDEAEEVKIGSFIGNHSRKKIDEIVDGRLTDIFEIIDSYLKKIKRSGLLPAGVIILGGGSLLHQITRVAKNTLQVPAQIAHSDFFVNSKNKAKDGTWLNVYGLLLSQSSDSDESEGGAFADFFGNIAKGLKNSFRQLLP